MARAIDADKAMEVAQIKYNDWNLAMAAADGQREINLCFKKQELFKAVKAVIDCVPTLTPPNEPLTLDELRASPHGKIKDSTLQSICNRANEIACRPLEGEEDT